ncbi:hypothetical protein PM085_15770 [Halorubrum ezzemoulense]|uniref:Uncharacterized protein n=1 Tax=Halorubrum ezzemoulense TaxID=337243 RepID=A0ABT4Z6L6_HALEZ|nr:hypothetical protein [Halorubrum ezzemoulense]MDB2293715.1 hypothetical protein [Halorubrum ezzemoulense]
MSDLFVVTTAVVGAYVSTGLLVLVAVDRIRTEPLPADQVAHTILAWPIVGFVAVAGVYAVWATQREVDEL